LDGLTPVLVPSVCCRGSQLPNKTFEVAHSECAKNRDSLRKVAINGPDRGAGAFGDQCRSEAFKTYFIDHRRSSIQKSGKARSVSRLNWFVSQGNTDHQRLHAIRLPFLLAAWVAFATPIVDSQLWLTTGV
jgi:hypothetical protein